MVIRPGVPNKGKMGEEEKLLTYASNLEQK